MDSLKKYAAMLTSFLHQYNTIIDSYVLDFFVKNSWEKLPVSWQHVLEKLEPYNMGNFLDSSYKLQMTAVWPLSLQAFRKAAFALAFPRCPISSSKPVELFLQDALNVNLENFESFYWESPNHEFRNKSGQHKSLLEVCRKHVKPKKQHEIFRIAQLVGAVLQNIGINHVVDIGSGLGHLSRVLHFEHNLRVITMEAMSSHALAAANFDKQAFVSLKKRNLKSSTPSKGMDTSRNGEILELPHHMECIITPDTTKEHFNEILQSVWCTHDNILQNKFSLLGLHACGDLSATLLKLFIEEPQAQAIFSVSCCYMKLNEKIDSEGYPLSSFVKALPHSYLSYEARELCCHALESYIERLKGNSGLLKIHCYRAILEKIIVSSYPSSRHLGLKNVKGADKMVFYEYAIKALEKCPLKIPLQDLTSPINDILLQEWKKVVFLYSIRLLIAPVIESLILLDRSIFLLENGCSSCIFPVFEPSLSPRNHVLLGIKKL